MNFAGTWTEKKKDGSKGGNRLNVIKMGPFLCILHFCGSCPTGAAFGTPLCGGSYAMEPGLYCGPYILSANSDGTIETDPCCGGPTYAKDESSTSQGAPMGSAEMER